MPEIAEIARIVGFLHKHIVGRTLRTVQVQEDDIIYGKVGCSASAFQKALTGKKVLDAQQQGKYFWLVMSSPPHPLLHFGMTGWMHFSNDESAYYKRSSTSIKQDKDSVEWPPRFWKFTLETAESPHAAAAFVDGRRLGRIRLVDCAADQLRQTPPLSLNGPDPVRDKDIVTPEWLAEQLSRKRVPIKAWLLNQANLSGVGNWVADEVMYNSRTHPEQYTNTLRSEQVKAIHKSLLYVCETAIACNAESARFPDDWLMRHRWGKGKNQSNKLPNGKNITFLTVGGRTSAIVPSVQKKTGPVAGDVDDAEKVKAEAAEEDEYEEDDNDQEDHIASKAKKSKRKSNSKSKTRKRKIEEDAEEEDKGESENDSSTAEKPKAKRTRKSLISDQESKKSSTLPSKLKAVGKKMERKVKAAVSVSGSAKVKKEESNGVKVEASAASTSYPSNGRRQSRRISKVS